MTVTNNTKDNLVAFMWDKQFGYGKDTLIPPGSTTKVEGIYIGQMGGGSCTINPEKNIVCQSTPDDEKGLFVDKDNTLFLDMGRSGIVVRHFNTPREPHTLQ